MICIICLLYAKTQVIFCYIYARYRLLFVTYESSENKYYNK